MSSIRKAGVAFYPGVGVSPDLVGLADTIRLKYKKRGDSSFTDAGISFVEENAGTYTAPLTLHTVGDYIVIIESTDDAIENLEGNVLVTAASIDDVNNAVTALQADMTSVKTQVDLLDEEKVNALSNDFVELNRTISDIRQLIDNDKIGLRIAGDFTDVWVVGEIIEEPDFPGETAEVLQATYNATTDETIITYTNETAGFDDVPPSIKSGPQEFTVLGQIVNPLDSVMEFVREINDNLAGGGSSLGALSSFVDNVELMLEGKAYTDTQGNAVLEENSHGLTNIYQEIRSQRTAITNDMYGYKNTIITEIGNIKDELEILILANEEAIADSQGAIELKIAAVQSVIDANKSSLEDNGYGLGALRELLDNMAIAAASHDLDVKALLNDGTNGLEAIKNTIMTKLNSMDSKLDNIGTATRSRIFV